MTRQDIYRRAVAAVARRRQHAERDALRRKNEIYTALPELAALHQRQSEAGALAGRLAADGDAAGAKAQLAALADIEKERAALLAQNQLSEASMAPRYTCRQCNDTGRHDGGPCECVQELEKRWRRQLVNDNGPLGLSTFESFSLAWYPECMEGVPISPRRLMEGNLRGCIDYAEEFGPCSPSLLMFGDAGLGKTHLALAIASQLLDEGFDVIYVSAQSAFAHIAEHRFEDEDEVFHSMLSADLLVLDDLGTEYLSAYVLSKLYELVNARMRRPTIYTTNISSQKDFEQRYTEKISSRLFGECEQMRFIGKDIRLQRDARV